MKIIEQKILSLTSQETVFPVQYEGTLASGKQIYLRYRGGYLSTYVYQDVLPENPTYHEKLGDTCDGIIELNTVLSCIKKYKITF